MRDVVARHAQHGQTQSTNKKISIKYTHKAENGSNKDHRYAPNPSRQSHVQHNQLQGNVVVQMPLVHLRRSERPLQATVNVLDKAERQPHSTTADGERTHSKLFP